MTAKEHAQMKLRDHEACDHKYAGTPITWVLRAIIDALPDEPQKPACKLWEDGEERLIDQQIEEVKAAERKPPLELLCEKMLIEIFHAGMTLRYYELQGELHSILGQHSEPPATRAEAQPPETIYESYLRKSDEDARKLRIMKAMEDIAHQDLTIQFGMDMEGTWYVSGTNFSYTVEEYVAKRAPEEPLWEGEGWILPGASQCPLPILPPECDKNLWRKIKVREVRP